MKLGWLVKFLSFFVLKHFFFVSLLGWFISTGSFCLFLLAFGPLQLLTVGFLSPAFPHWWRCPASNMLRVPTWQNWRWVCLVFSAEGEGKHSAWREKPVLRGFPCFE